MQTKLVALWSDDATSGRFYLGALGEELQSCIAKWDAVASGNRWYHPLS